MHIYMHIVMHIQVGEISGRLGSDGAKAFAQEVQALVTNFNQAIQDEAKDRKYRFVVKRLMKTHQRAGEALDEELDFYKDDDDVAVAFTGSNGEKWFCLGNIEETTVATAAVDERRACSDRGAGSIELSNLDRTSPDTTGQLSDSIGHHHRTAVGQSTGQSPDSHRT